MAKVGVAGNRRQLDFCDLRGSLASDFGAGDSGPRNWNFSAQSLFFPVYSLNDGVDAVEDVYRR